MDLDLSLICSEQTREIGYLEGTNVSLAILDFILTTSAELDKSFEMNSRCRPNNKYALDRGRIHQT